MLTIIRYRGMGVYTEVGAHLGHYSTPTPHIYTRMHDYKYIVHAHMYHHKHVAALRVHMPYILCVLRTIDHHLKQLPHNVRVTEALKLEREASGERRSSHPLVSALVSTPSSSTWARTSPLSLSLPLTATLSTSQSLPIP